MSGNGFDEYRIHIMSRLDDMAVDIKGLRDSQMAMQNEMASMKMQVRITTAFYGVLGGMLATVGAFILQLFG